MNFKAAGILLILSVLFLIGGILPWLEIYGEIPVNNFSFLIEIGWIGSLISLGYIFFTIKHSERTQVIKWIFALNVAAIAVYFLLLVFVILALMAYPLFGN